MSFSKKLSELIECTAAYWVLRTTDWLGWSVFANHTLRPAILRAFGFKIGSHCHVNTGLTIHSRKHRVQIGHHTTMNKNCLFDAPVSPIIIGNYCSIGFNVSFINVDHQHGLSANGRRDLSVTEPIILEDYVWIGSNVTVLPGVTIGKGAIVGAGAVVTKSIPPNSLALGVPAKVVKTLESHDERVEVHAV